MSRSTPRKTRNAHARGHHRHQSNPRLATTSDYESDAVNYMTSRPAPPPPQLLHRTNTDLNLAVLQRYRPSISSILSIAANAVVYTFSPESLEWDKAGVEGTLFVCEQERTVAGPRACVFVLNRRGLENVIIDLERVRTCEVTEELVSFQLEDGDSESDDGQPRVIGIWIHADNDDTRKINATLMRQSWMQVREARKGGVDTAQPATEETVGPAMQAMGRKLSLSDLFGRKDETGMWGRA